MVESEWDDAIKELSIISKRLDTKMNQAKMTIAKLAMEMTWVNDLKIVVPKLKDEVARW